MPRRLRSAVCAAAVVAASAACSFSAGSGVSVDKDELAKKISAQVGRAPESAKCPDNLKGEVGATTHCTLNDAGKTYGVDVTVTKVEGTDVVFDLKLNDKSQ